MDNRNKAANGDASGQKLMVRSLQSENPGQPALFFERIKTGIAAITSLLVISLFLIIRSADNCQQKMKKKDRILACRRTDAVSRWLRSRAARKPTRFFLTGKNAPFPAYWPVGREKTC
jgi:hypothetical protein